MQLNSECGMSNAEFRKKTTTEDTANLGGRRVESSFPFSVASVLFLCDSVVDSFRNPH